jgi:hypothetical protein
MNQNDNDLLQNSLSLEERLSLSGLRMYGAPAEELPDHGRDAGRGGEGVPDELGRVPRPVEAELSPEEKVRYQPLAGASEHC